MDDAESRLIGNEEGNKAGTKGNNPGQNATSQTSPPPTSFTLLTNEGASNQPGVDAFRPRPAGNLNSPPNAGAIAPPSYPQTIQMEPIPTENKESVPNEPPLEYSGPSPGYNPSQSGENRFHGATTMSITEEQKRTNAVENEIGRLATLSSVVQALEDRDRQNGNAPVLLFPREPVNGRLVIGTRAQLFRRVTTIRQAWMTYLIVVIVLAVIAVGVGIAASRHFPSPSSSSSSSSSSGDFDPSHYLGGNSDDHTTDCSLGTCKNGGTCKDVGTALPTYCVCAPGYQGAHCEEGEKAVAARVECSLNCHNRGTCWITSGGGPKCYCHSGYTGEYCADVVKTRCVYNTCHNGGTCWKLDHVISCECAPGYGGDSCQVRTTTLKPTSL